MPWNLLRVRADYTPLQAKIGLACIGVLICVGVTLLSPARPGLADDRVLPPEVLAQLNDQFPGWQMGRISPEVLKFLAQEKIHHSSNLVQGDFDGDGGTDYALKITAGGHWYLLAFLRRGTGFKEYQLVKAPGAGLDTYLTLHRKGDRGFNSQATKTFTYSRDTFELCYFEKGSVAYLYQNGLFKEIYTSD